MPRFPGLEALALEMKSAQDSGLQIEPFTSRFSGFDISAAYQVAHLVHRARTAEGAKPIGRKIGFTNSNMWSAYGVCEPIWAHVYDTSVRFLTGTQTFCGLGRFTEPKIEPEIVFRFREAPPAGAGVVDVIDAVDWVAHGFEIVQSHFPGWRFRAADTVADQALHGMLLIGPPRSLSEFTDDPVTALESFVLTLGCGGREIERGKGGNVLGNPLAAVTHLVSILAKQTDFMPLQRGEIVTTGTITTAQSIQAGETWISQIEGIPLQGLTIEFDI